MTIICCIKQVHDLDIVLKDDWIVDESTCSVDISYANKIMNTFDETSLELMLRLSDKQSIDTRVVTLGDIQSESILRKALAVGVSKGARIEVQSDLEFQPEQVAFHLYQYILTESNSKEVDMVMCGRQADNGNHGQTGQLLAAMLGWPCITMVTDIEKVGDSFKISRLTQNAIEHIYVNTPVVVTVTQSANSLLRMATLKATLEAKKKVIEIFRFDKLCLSNCELKKLSINKPEKNCVFLEDHENCLKTDQLIKLLREQMMEEH